MEVRFPWLLILIVPILHCARLGNPLHEAARLPRSILPHTWKPTKRDDNFVLTAPENATWPKTHCLGLLQENTLTIPTALCRTIPGC